MTAQVWKSGQRAKGEAQARFRLQELVKPLRNKGCKGNSDHASIASFPRAAVDVLVAQARWSASDDRIWLCVTTSFRANSRSSGFTLVAAPRVSLAKVWWTQLLSASPGIDQAGRFVVACLSCLNMSCTESEGVTASAAVDAKAPAPQAALPVSLD